MSGTATDKKPEDAPTQMEWVFGNGTKDQINSGWSQFFLVFIIFCCWLGCFIWFGMIPQVGRGMIGCFWLFFIWGCVWIRRLPVKRCDPECYQCRRYS
jgi:hypothetical protein